MMGLAQGVNVPQVSSAYQGREVAPTYQGREVMPTYQGNQFQEERILDRMQDYQNPYTENVLDRLQKEQLIDLKNNKQEEGYNKHKEVLLVVVEIHYKIYKQKEI
ncbi:MAG: hypothetical protein CM15mV96_290 [uncultured marine virus]|nr:MAG: hypothetical protein CM15mV96_290 [uncultured marine virus]